MVFFKKIKGQDNELKRIIITAGGTGGHIFPGIAVAKMLMNKQVAVRWVGTTYGLEKELVPKESIPIHYLHVRGLRGKGLSQKLKAPWLMLKALMDAHKYISQFQPQVVFSLGGYASGPMALMSKIRGIPLVVHEQNAAPGLTNRLLAPMAQAILSGFLNPLCRYSTFELVGNPVRDEILNGFSRESSEEALQSEVKVVKNILVLGGSQGAQLLNRVLPEALSLLQQNKQLDIQIVHQTGSKHVEFAQSQYDNTNLNAQVVGFIEDMAGAYAWADLVIARAGALTVSEIAIAGVASIFVPLAIAVDDHQTKNAQILVDAGAAQSIAEKDFSAQKLVQYLEPLCTRQGIAQEMSMNARKVARFEATETICERLYDICQSTNE